MFRDEPTPLHSALLLPSGWPFSPSRKQAAQLFCGLPRAIQIHAACQRRGMRRQFGLQARAQRTNQLIKGQVGLQRTCHTDAQHLP